MKNKYFTASIIMMTINIVIVFCVPTVMFGIVTTCRPLRTLQRLHKKQKTFWWKLRKRKGKPTKTRRRINLSSQKKKKKNTTKRLFCYKKWFYTIIKNTQWIIFKLKGIQIFYEKIQFIKIINKLVLLLNYD
jgi:hypothetical protein